MAFATTFDAQMWQLDGTLFQHSYAQHRDMMMQILGPMIQYYRSGGAEDVDEKLRAEWALYSFINNGVSVPRRLLPWWTTVPDALSAVYDRYQRCEPLGDRNLPLHLTSAGVAATTTMHDLVEVVAPENLPHDPFQCAAQFLNVREPDLRLTLLNFATDALRKAPHYFLNDHPAHIYLLLLLLFMPAQHIVGFFAARGINVTIEQLEHRAVRVLRSLDPWNVPVYERWSRFRGLQEVMRQFDNLVDGPWADMHPLHSMIPSVVAEAVAREERGEWVPEWLSAAPLPDPKRYSLSDSASYSVSDSE